MLGPLSFLVDLRFATALIGVGMFAAITLLRWTAQRRLRQDRAPRCLLVRRGSSGSDLVDQPRTDPRSQFEIYNVGDDHAVVVRCGLAVVAPGSTVRSAQHVPGGLPRTMAALAPGSSSLTASVVAPGEHRPLPLDRWDWRAPSIAQFLEYSDLAGERRWCTVMPVSGWAAPSEELLESSAPPRHHGGRQSGRQSG